MKEEKAPRQFIDMSGGQMKVRDIYATINGDKTTYDFHGLQIITKDGRTIFEVRIEKDGSLDVSAGDFCKIDGKVLEDRFLIQCIASNRIRLVKSEYKG